MHRERAKGRGVGIENFFKQYKYSIHCWYLVTKSCLTLVTPWTAALQVPLSMGFPRQKNTGVGYHFLLQGIFLTQGSNLCLLLGRQFLYH